MPHQWLLVGLSKPAARQSLASTLPGQSVGFSPLDGLRACQFRSVQPCNRVASRQIGYNRLGSDAMSNRIKLTSCLERIFQFLWLGSKRLLWACAGQPALQTVFFGGGTPTLIPPPLLEQILDVLRVKVGIAPGAEVSMEADPGVPPHEGSLPRLAVHGLMPQLHLAVSSMEDGHPLQRRNLRRGAANGVHVAGGESLQRGCSGGGDARSSVDVQVFQVQAE